MRSCGNESGAGVSGGRGVIAALAAGTRPSPRTKRARRARLVGDSSARRRDSSSPGTAACSGRVAGDSKSSIGAQKLVGLALAKLLDLVEQRLLDQACEVLDGETVERSLGVDGDAERPIDAGQDLPRHHRIPAQLEEGVVHPDTLDIERALPQPGDRTLELVPRLRVLLLEVGARVESRRGADAAERRHVHPQYLVEERDPGP